MGYNSTPGFRPERLSAARRAAGLSQRELAERVGVTRQQLVKWESTTTPGAPRPTILRALAQALQVEVHDLADQAGTLADLRRAQGLTQLKLAAATGIPRSTIQALESGTIQRIRDEHATAIAASLKVSRRAVQEAHALRREPST